MANPFKRDADYETPPSKRAARLSANLTKGAPKRQPDQVRPRLDKAHDRQEAGIDEGVENNLPRQRPGRRQAHQRNSTGA
ncbi:hypothetical protein [Brevundimonas sp.]|uniref:hypothetical protein n=1 Tax=Brevundimonas sp. TaxID=1871086 RepID=UPI003BA8DC54